jgi:hypothetical protein
MSYILAGSTIRSPHDFDVANSTQVAQNRTLGGAITRDYFGSNKRVWTLNYENCNVTDFNIINAIYTSYLATGTAQTWQVTETNYTISSTSVHVDLVQRSFKIRGNDYLSDFSLILTEA